MGKHLERELGRLKRQILALSAVVEESVQRAVDSIQNRDADLARHVIQADENIDQMEVDIEEECLKILALHQPVAIDLRFIVAVLKINNDLERIGDLAVNIAERALFLATRGRTAPFFDFQGMARLVQQMLKDSLDALVNIDPSLARKVCISDDEVDEMNRQMFKEAEEMFRQQPEGSDVLLHTLSISRHLERIADLATNIAEDVIYMAEGDIVRHQTEDFLAP